LVSAVWRQPAAMRPPGRSACAASPLPGAPPSPPMRYAPVTATAPEPPSPFPKATSHEPLQTLDHPLRQDTRTRDALSEGGAGLGRAHRLGPGAGQELA